MIMRAAKSRFTGMRLRTPRILPKTYKRGLTIRSALLQFNLSNSKFSLIVCLRSFLVNVGTLEISMNTSY